jgi:hypothetical protein
MSDFLTPGQEMQLDVRDHGKQLYRLVQDLAEQRDALKLLTAKVDEGNASIAELATEVGKINTQSAKSGGKWGAAVGIAAQLLFALGQRIVEEIKTLGG